MKRKVLAKIAMAYIMAGMFIFAARLNDSLAASYGENRRSLRGGAAREASVKKSLCRYQA